MASDTSGSASATVLPASAAIAAIALAPCAHHRHRPPRRRTPAALRPRPSQASADRRRRPADGRVHVRRSRRPASATRQSGRGVASADAEPLAVRGERPVGVRLVARTGRPGRTGRRPSRHGGRRDSTAVPPRRDRRRGSGRARRRSAADPGREVEQWLQEVLGRRCSRRGAGPGRRSLRSKSSRADDRARTAARRRRAPRPLGPGPAAMPSSISMLDPVGRAQPRRRTHQRPRDVEQVVAGDADAHGLAESGRAARVEQPLVVGVDVGLRRDTAPAATVQLGVDLLHRQVGALDEAHLDAGHRRARGAAAPTRPARAGRRAESGRYACSTMPASSVARTRARRAPA